MVDWNLKEKIKELSAVENPSAVESTIFKHYPQMELQLLY